ncbi:hypothetical protein [Bacillus phage SRT01hs]|uniref:Uncharacterized protein n=1 Tax=Bacillus phage SRT01hs TaxID=2847044 RepID=A0A6B9SY98_9CAUD|nr:hypothetical protein H3022_gp01 [Bacillus phage SRT01hs]QHJ75859.1 hypothetical protein [Bacillus phage SRT01hs]
MTITTEEWVMYYELNSIRYNLTFDTKEEAFTFYNNFRSFEGLVVSHFCRFQIKRRENYQPISFVRSIYNTKGQLIY